MIAKKIWCAFLAFEMVGSVALGAAVAAEPSKNKGHEGETLNVFNWGEFMSNGSDGLLNVNAEFEKETGIHVNYSTFSSNEELYAKIKNGAVVYDVIIPSDYMVARMKSEGFLAKINFKNIPNFKNIFSQFKMPNYDPTNEYSVPYLWGLVGVIYNKKLVSGPVLGFDSLWDKKLAKNILMFMNSRDSFGIAQKRLGLSFNTDSTAEVRAAAAELRKQKKLVQAYVMDEIYDKMQSGEAAIAPYYSGDAVAMMQSNPDLDFVIPKEGTNRFVDAACVPANCSKKELAELYINFLCRPEVALANALYSGCSTPNQAAFNALPEERKHNKIMYPDKTVLERTECYVNNPKEINELMDSLWIEVMISDENNNIWIMPVFIVVCVVASVYINISRAKRRKR